MMRIRSSSTMVAMVSDLDILRSAKLLIDQHGEDAGLEAAKYNERAALGIDDQERTDRALRGIVGKRVTYHGLSGDGAWKRGLSTASG